MFFIKHFYVTCQFHLGYNIQCMHKINIKPWFFFQTIVMIDRIAVVIRIATTTIRALNKRVLVTGG